MSDADKYWGRTLTNIALIFGAAWLFSTAAWLSIETRKLLWEMRMEASVQIQPACTWAPDAPPRCAPVLEDPFEPLKPDGLRIPKGKFLPPPQIDLGEPEELPLVAPAVKVHLL